MTTERKLVNYCRLLHGIVLVVPQDDTEWYVLTWKLLKGKIDNKIMWQERIWIFYTQSELIFVECVYMLRAYRIKPSLHQFSPISLQRVVPFFVLEMSMFSFLIC